MISGIFLFPISFLPFPSCYRETCVESTTLGLRNLSHPCSVVLIDHLSTNQVNSPIVSVPAGLSAHSVMDHVAFVICIYMAVSRYSWS